MTVSDTPIEMQEEDRREKTRLVLALSIVILSLFVYWQVQDHEFLIWDDYEYVVENPHVRSGLSLDNVLRAFTSAHASNWHPVTWLSHMLDCELYGLNPAGHHLNSLILHLINTALVFLLLERMTNAPWQSAFVAAVFALHPLHVESVAWVSERKDVLSTFFLFLALLAYLRYTTRPTARRYAILVVLYALGLLSKPMLVTLPLLLLILDYWPLGRTALSISNGLHPSAPTKFTTLVWEKLPLFVLAGLSALVTFFVSKADQATASLQILSLEWRVENALVSYVAYLVKSFWPVELAFFYPHPLGTLPAWEVVGSSFLLASISLFVFKCRRKRPYLAIGWLWYVITLMPVIGFVQVGSQAMADRYTYVPLIGISIMVAWGATTFLKRKAHRVALLGLALAVILLLSLLTSSEIRHWRTGEALFRRALQVTSGNYTAHYQLGIEYTRLGTTELAIKHFSEAINSRPEHFPAHHGLGIALAAQGRFDEALEHFMAALRIRPKNAGVLSSIGDAFSGRGDFEEAIAFYSRAIEIDPSLWAVHNNMGFAYFKRGMGKEAILHFEEALKLNPSDRLARQNLYLARKNNQGNNH